MFDFIHMSRSLRQTFSVRASEWALALMILNLSIVMAFSPSLFSENDSYRALAATMPQSSWAALCFTVGAGRLIVLLINGSWRRTPHLRAGGAFISMLFWFQISLGFAQAPLLGTAMAIYPVLFFLDGHNLMRAISDAGIVDMHFKRVAGSDGNHT